jgi:hypothetical protein
MRLRKRGAKGANRKPKTRLGTNALNRPDKVDPTRTGTLRQRFGRAMAGRFNQLKSDIVRLIVTEDVLGLKGLRPFNPLTNTKYDFASTQVNVYDEYTIDAFTVLQMMLDPEDVIKYETQPHVTVRYGLHQHPDTLDKVRMIVETHSPVSLILGPVSVFHVEKDTGPQEVLKVEVHSRSLEELNTRLGALPNTQNHEYTPHMTIAYLKPGTAEKYAGIYEELYGVVIEFDSVHFSDPDGYQTEIMLLGELVENSKWANKEADQQLKSFQDWLRQRLDEHLLGADEEEMWRSYINEAFEKGLGRAFDDFQSRLVKLVGKSELEKEIPLYEGSRRQFLRDSFRQPVAVERVKLLASRSFNDLKGVTDAMSTKMVRSLTDGLVAGHSPRQIARQLVKDVDGIGTARAKAIANTEIIRAHNEGQLLGLENLGVEEVGVAVEWQTARSGVCKKCEVMQGVILSIQEAHGMIPRHPNCRCAWIPANVGEPSAGQKRTRKEINDAIKASRKGASEKDDWGPGKPISTERPESVFNERCCGDLLMFYVGNYSPTQKRDWHGRFSVGGGGGPAGKVGEGGALGTKGNENKKKMRDQWTSNEKAEFNKLTKERSTLNKKIKDKTATPEEHTRYETVMKRINELRDIGRDRGGVEKPDKGDGRGVPKRTSHEPLKKGDVIKINDHYDAEVAGVDVSHPGLGGEKALVIHYIDKATGRRVGEAALMKDGDVYVLGSHEINQEARGKGLGRQFIPLLAQRLGRIESDAAHSADAEKMWQALAAHGAKKENGIWSIEASGPDKPKRIRKKTEVVETSRDADGSYLRLEKRNEHGDVKGSTVVRRDPEGVFSVWYSDGPKYSFDTQGHFRTMKDAEEHARKLLDKPKEHLRSEGAITTAEYLVRADVRRDSPEVKKHSQDYVDKANKHYTELEGLRQKLVQIDKDMLKEGIAKENAWRDKVAELDKLRQDRDATTPVTDERRRVNDAIAAKALEIDAALEVHLNHQNEMNAKAWAAMKEFARSTGPVIDNPDLPARSLGSMENSTYKAIQDANEHLTGFLAEMHRDRLQKTFLRQIAADQEQRAFYRGEQHGGKDPTAFVTKMNGPDVVLHEVGHSLEERPEVYNMALGFMHTRIGKEEFKHMGSGYRDYEVGAADKFFGESGSRYAGKFYTTKNTEIISMGIERLRRDPMGFKTADPEYFRFVVGALTGKLFQ